LVRPITHWTLRVNISAVKIEKTIWTRGGHGTLGTFGQAGAARATLPEQAAVIFVGVVVGGVVIEEVFTVRDKAAVIGLTPVISYSWLICWLPYLFLANKVL